VRVATWLLAFAISVAGIAEAQPLGQILRDSARFDRRPVLVHGTVGFIEPAAGDRQGFLLVEAGAHVRVLAPAQPAVRSGDRVEVEGTWNMVGSYIDAFRVSMR
jgi:hypothetical protein